MRGTIAEIGCETKLTKLESIVATITLTVIELCANVSYTKRKPQCPSMDSYKASRSVCDCRMSRPGHHKIVISYYIIIKIIRGQQSGTTSMGCATTHCMISSAQSPSKTHVCIQRLLGILQRQRQTEDLCFHSSLHSHWFLFSRSSRLPRPLHFFG